MPQARSAGVYHREIDESLFVQSPGLTAFGVVGGAHKGEKNKIIRVTSQTEYLTKLGTPNTPMGRAMFQYLRFGREGYMVRVGKNDLVATIDIVDSSAVKTFTINGKTSGEAFNGLKIYILTSLVGGAGKFKLVVEEAGFPIETWDNLDKDTMEDLINDTLTGSEYISVVNDPGNTNDPALDQVKVLAGGDSGISGLVAADYIGEKTGLVSTGLQLYANPEQFEIDILAVPGQSDSSLIIGLQDLCEVRGDCYGLIDPPFGLNVDEVIDFHNGAGAWGGSHPALNTNRACLDWPWHQIFDPYTNKEEWMAPSGVTAGILAYNDLVAEPWFAAAGRQRGKVTSSLAIEYSPDVNERHLLNASYRINPYVNFKSEGIIRWGQETLQRATTSLQGENVRRMLFYAEKQLNSVYLQMNFQPHDKKSWKELKNLADGVLGPIQSGRGLYSYSIIIDETTNTPEMIDQNKAVVKLILKPTRTMKEILVNWTLLRTGAKFDESI